MIFRAENLDRYDGRNVIMTNFLDTYKRMSAFAQKYLSNPFVLVDHKRCNIEEDNF